MIRFVFFSSLCSSQWHFVVSPAASNFRGNSVVSTENIFCKHLQRWMCLRVCVSFAMFSFLMNQTRAKSPSNFDRGKEIAIEVKFRNEQKNRYTEKKIDLKTRMEGNGRMCEQTSDGIFGNINGNELERKVNENGLKTRIKSSTEHFIAHNTEMRARKKREVEVLRKGIMNPSLHAIK